MDMTARSLHSHSRVNNSGDKTIPFFTTCQLRKPAYFISGTIFHILHNISTIMKNITQIMVFWREKWRPKYFHGNGSATISRGADMQKMFFIGSMINLRLLNHQLFTLSPCPALNFHKVYSFCQCAHIQFKWILILELFINFLFSNTIKNSNNGFNL